MTAIIPFRPEHTSGVVGVILPIQQHEFGIPISLDAQPDLMDITAFYQTGHGNFWVAVDDGAVVGTLGLLDIGERRVALRKMFVAAAYRGSAGVAGRLLETALAWCRSRGVQEIVLGTTSRFLAAHRFYEKHGFQQIGRDELPSTFPIMSVDTRFYRLSGFDRNVEA